MNVGACIARPRKCYEFAGSFDENNAFSAGRPLVAPTFTEESALLSSKT